MSNRPLDSEIFFDVETPLDFKVRVTHRYWELIVTIKHPIMKGREQNVKAALSEPDEVRISRSDPNVYLFYKTERERRWVCAVTKRLNGEGFLITAYLTDAVKEGTKIWPLK